MISFEDFKKVDLRIVKIVSAERIEGSDKLLKIHVNAGPELATNPEGTRQIIAGIGKKYNPEDLVGREIVIVANLEPRSLMGYESQGMLLAVDNENGPVLLIPSEDVLPGSRAH